MGTRSRSPGRKENINRGSATLGNYIINNSLKVGTNGVTQPAALLLLLLRPSSARFAHFKAAMPQQYLYIFGKGVLLSIWIQVTDL